MSARNTIRFERRGAGECEVRVPRDIAPFPTVPWTEDPGTGEASEATRDSSLAGPRLVRR